MTAREQMMAASLGLDVTVAADRDELAVILDEVAGSPVEVREVA
jgi:hypothetical protein